MAAADDQLAAHHGVAGALVRALRKEQLEEGAHYYTDKGAVIYTAEGLVRLDELLDVDTAPVPTPLAEPLYGPVVEIYVVKLQRNPIWVTVRTPNGETADVRVRAQKAIQVRQKLRCRLRRDGKWECCHPGCSCPLPPL